MPQLMTFVEATADYENWLAQHVGIVDTDLRDKHLLMKQSEFSFLRATFYRWAQTWPLLRAEGLEDADTPEVLAVGDLHVENFGAWRDAEARLVWGINDFDEACRMPYSIDLVRLAASTFLAIEAGQFRAGRHEACAAIQSGYRESLLADGAPFVLGEHHPWLLDLVRPARPVNFWEKMHALKGFEGKVPKAAKQALESMLPQPKMEYRLTHRVAGLGSRGRRRFVAVTEYAGGPICREAKELAPSAWWWANGSSTGTAIRYQKALDISVRSPDPFARQTGSWIVRRLAPDCAKIALADVPKEKDADKLLFAMGWEAANVHLGSRKTRAILKDLDRRKKNWLNDSAAFLLERLHSDWEEWKSAK